MNQEIDKFTVLAYAMLTRSDLVDSLTPTRSRVQILQINVSQDDPTMGQEQAEIYVKDQDNGMIKTARLDSLYLLSDREHSSMRSFTHNPVDGTRGHSLSTRIYTLAHFLRNLGTTNQVVVHNSPRLTEYHRLVSVQGSYGSLLFVDGALDYVQLSLDEVYDILARENQYEVGATRAINNYLARGINEEYSQQAAKKALYFAQQMESQRFETKVRIGPDYIQLVGNQQDTTIELKVSVSSENLDLDLDLDQDLDMVQETDKAIVLEARHLCGSETAFIQPNMCPALATFWIQNIFGYSSIE